MRKLVATNIKQSFTKLVENNTAVDATFALLAGQDPDYEECLLIEDCVPFRPILYLDGDTIHCAQDGFLGFYALQQSALQLLKSVNFHVAGNLLVSNGLYGPAIASHYTAAFRALHSFLAMEGHVIFDSTSWPLPSRRSERFADHRHVAILTKNNNWILERRVRNHQTVWAEVRQVFAARLDELPGYFHGLFDYMYRGQFEEQLTLDVLADVLERSPLDDFIGRRLDEFRVKLSDRLPEFLQHISETRHRSIYESFGSDPYVHEAICNGEAFSSAGLENQSLEYRQFCESLLADVACDLLRIAESLTVSEEIALALFLTTYMTPFDKPQIDRIGTIKLKDALTRIHEWIIHPIERTSDVSG